MDFYKNVFVQGNTLYTHLHLRRDKFYMNKVTLWSIKFFLNKIINYLIKFTQVIIIAQQIAQGMGYLHHKGIIHKVMMMVTIAIIINMILSLLN